MAGGPSARVARPSDPVCARAPPTSSTSIPESGRPSSRAVAQATSRLASTNASSPMRVDCTHWITRPGHRSDAGARPAGSTTTIAWPRAARKCRLEVEDGFDEVVGRSRDGHRARHHPRPRERGERAVPRRSLLRGAIGRPIGRRHAMDGQLERGQPRRIDGQPRARGGIEDGEVPARGHEGWLRAPHGERDGLGGAESLAESVGERRGESDPVRRARLRTALDDDHRPVNGDRESGQRRLHAHHGLVERSGIDRVAEARSATARRAGTGPSASRSGAR